MTAPIDWSWSDRRPWARYRSPRVTVVLSVRPDMTGAWVAYRLGEGLDWDLVQVTHYAEPQPLSELRAWAEARGAELVAQHGP